MTCYLASDVHLRLDHPERGWRFARWVKRLDGGDTLLIVGDLCDFWMGARLRESELMQCEGLRALADFRGSWRHAGDPSRQPRSLAVPVLPAGAGCDTLGRAA